MEERKITQQELYDVFHKYYASFPNLYRLMINELFPEPPKAKELIRCWNRDGYSTWRAFVRFESNGSVVVANEDSKEFVWKSYRRQTPAERGES